MLTQQLVVVQKERDELYQRFSNCIYEVQEKTGLKNLILERKMETLGEALEVTDAQVKRFRSCH